MRKIGAYRKCRKNFRPLSIARSHQVLRRKVNLRIYFIQTKVVYNYYDYYLYDARNTCMKSYLATRIQRKMCYEICNFCSFRLGNIILAYKYGG